MSRFFLILASLAIVAVVLAQAGRTAPRNGPISMKFEFVHANPRSVETLTLVADNNTRATLSRPSVRGDVYRNIEATPMVNSDGTVTVNLRARVDLPNGVIEEEVRTTVTMKMGESRLVSGVTLRVEEATESREMMMLLTPSFSD
jgi:hypothetical protein